MKTLGLISVMVWPSWDIASLGELASGVSFRPWMTFHMFGPSELDIVSWRRSFQLSVLASLIALIASQQASIHPWRFWCIVRQRLFRVPIWLARFRFLAAFRFFDVSCCRWDQDVIETRDLKRLVRFIREIVHF